MISITKDRDIYTLDGMHLAYQKVTHESEGETTPAHSRYQDNADGDSEGYFDGESGTDMMINRREGSELRQARIKNMRAPM